MNCIYKSFIVAYRRFWDHTNDLNLVEAKKSNVSLKTLGVSLNRLVGYAIIQHVLEELDKEVIILQKRVHLVRDASEKIVSNTERGILSLKDIILLSIELELTTHPVIEECRLKVKKYSKGVEFASIIASPEQISSLSFSDINDGIEVLKEFNTIIPNAEDTILRALEHKRIVEYELFHILKPMQDMLVDCMVAFDKRSGSLIAKNPMVSNVFDRIGLLRNLLMAHSGMKFNCTDLGFLYSDCGYFIRFMTDYVPNFNALGGLEFLKKLQPTGDIFKQQIVEFRKWTDLQISVLRLQQQLQLGAVPRSDMGGEEDVQIEVLQLQLQPVEELESPPPAFIAVIKAARAVLEVTKDFLSF